MRQSLKVCLILGAGLSLFFLPLRVVRADQPASAREAHPLAFPAGFQNISGPPDAGVYSGLAKVTERALTKGDFDKMLAELSKPDRERARAFKGVDQGRLDVQIARIQELWKSKFAKDFKIDDKVVFGAPLLIIPGEVTDSATALAHWPVPATPDQAVAASGKERAVPAGEVKKETKDQKLEKGRHVTLVRFPAMAGRPELTISMIHHLPAFWRIDIPDDRGGEQIYNDLLAQLTYLADHSDKWPNDVNEAGRVVAYHVLAALYGVNVTPTPAKG
jgi:hypothetical protein